MTQSTHVKTTSIIARALTLLALIAVVSVLAGCGSDKNDGGSTGTASTTVQKDDAAAAKVPAAIAKDGTLTVAMDASYPPNEFFDKDGKTIIGMDADLANALAQTLGLKAELKNVTFDAILPGLAAGKYDIAMSSFTDTKEREKTVDMVTYLNAGTKFYTSADNPTDISGLDDLCGLTVAVEKGTTQADDANAQSKKCTSAGKKKVTVDVFPDQNGANLALTSGRAQIGMADSPVAAYIIKQSDGKLQQTGVDYGEAPYGIAVNKDSGLTPAIQAGMQSLMDSGKYKEILTKWNLADEGIDTAKVNDGIE
ncbi:MAG: ABC transporter substrate-binding protein [Solirubrobacterales bacterium]